MIDCIKQEPKAMESNQQQFMVNQQQQLQPLLAIYQGDVQLRNQQVLQHEVPGQQQQGTGTNELIGYYFGSISRETAEWILRNHGNQVNGAYLLRSSGPNDDFVLSLMVNHHQLQQQQQQIRAIAGGVQSQDGLEVLHYKIVETEDSFVALHGQIGDEKFATIDELIEKAQGVATKPCWPISRLSLDSQILPPTYWGLTVDQVRLAILIKARQWGFPLLSSLFESSQAAALQGAETGPMCAQNGIQNTGGSSSNNNNSLAGATTLNNETIRTLIYKSLHEFQPWFHGKISREEAERRIEDGPLRDGRFLVRERDNFSYAMCISHKRTTKHYRIDVLPTGELAIQDGRKFTSLMALVSHYTIMSDGLWCALTEACLRPVLTNAPLPINANSPQTNLGSSNNSANLVNSSQLTSSLQPQTLNKNFNHQLMLANQNLYCIPPPMLANGMISAVPQTATGIRGLEQQTAPGQDSISTNAQLDGAKGPSCCQQNSSNTNSLICANQSGVSAIKAPIKELLQNINHKWTLLLNQSKNQSLNSFLFGCQNPLNNHCKQQHSRNHHHSHHHHHNHHNQQRRAKCKNGHTACACVQQKQQLLLQQQQQANCSARGNSLLANQYINNCGQQQATMARLNSHSFDNCQEPATSTLARLAHSNINNRSANICPLAASVSSTNARPNANGSMLKPQNNFKFYPANGLEQHRGPGSNLNSQSSIVPFPIQNSGFTMNAQSFIGSPLFALKQQLQAANSAGELNLASSRVKTQQQQQELGGGDFNSKQTHEEKLISPAQSISANLDNNPYQLSNHDGIYAGSQTSTAIINDHNQLASSSSSSSGNRNLTRNFNLANSSNEQMRAKLSNSFQRAQNYGPTKSAANCRLPLGASAADSTQLHATNNLTSTTNPAGPILCGQHAGPAYRYTNCNDENSFRPCQHRPLANQRASDDLHLISSSSQLTGPAAMTKFVQFQDGQCLRTHRDTRSIQMAYLTSQQQQLLRQQTMPAGKMRPNNNKYRLNNSHQTNLSDARPSQQQAVRISRNQHIQNSSSGSSGSSDPSNAFNFRPQSARQAASQGLEVTGDRRPESGANCAEIDLMYCGDDDFEFKYDPKLIKSSSIETLCGMNQDEEDNKSGAADLFDLSSFKTNSELVMSLKSCWPAPPLEERPERGILSPIVGEACCSPGGLQHQDETGISCSSGLDFQVIAGAGRFEEQFKKKHDLDELTTALLAELTASLKEQVDLKNKRAGFGLYNNKVNQAHNDANQTVQRVSGNGNDNNQSSEQRVQQVQQREPNPLELINEFDTLIPAPSSAGDRG